MVAVTTDRKLQNMGFKINDEVKDRLDKLASEASKNAELTEKETEVFRKVILSKSADMALINGRSEIILSDLDVASLICVPVFKPCVKSTLIKNPNVTASVLTPGDARILEIIGITKNVDLANTSADEIVDKMIDQIQTQRTGKVTESEKNVLLKRAEIWIEEANLLCSL